MSIRSILNGLEKEDDTVAAFLADQKELWPEMVKRYGSAHGRLEPEHKMN